MVAEGPRVKSSPQLDEELRPKPDESFDEWLPRAEKIIEELRRLQPN